VETLTKKTEKNVQNVEKSTPKPKPDKVSTKKPTKKAIVKPVLFDISKFDQEKIDAAEAMGLPLRQLANTMNDYAQSVEVRFEILAKAIPTNEDIEGAMGQALVKIRQKQIEEYRKAVAEGNVQQGQGRGGGSREFLENMLARAVMGGGGGVSETDKMFIELGKETMLVGKYFMRHVLEKGAKDVIEKVDADMAKIRESKGE